MLVDKSDTDESAQIAQETQSLLAGIDATSRACQGLGPVARRQLFNRRLDIVGFVVEIF